MEIPKNIPKVAFAKFDDTDKATTRLGHAFGPCRTSWYCVREELFPDLTEIASRR